MSPRGSSRRANIRGQPAHSRSRSSRPIRSRRANRSRSSGRSCSTATDWKSPSRTAPFHGAARRAGKAHVHVVIVGLAHRDARAGGETAVQLSRHQGRSGRKPHGALTAYLFDARGVANRHLVVVREGRSSLRERRASSSAQSLSMAETTSSTRDERRTFLEKRAGCR